MADIKIDVHPQSIPFITMALLAEIAADVKVLKQQVAFLEVQAMVPDNLAEADVERVAEDRHAHQKQIAEQLLEAAAQDISRRLKELDTTYIQMTKK